jgi:phosphotransferase system  glucose/maltose/N-acetylglucosamine-specific IIC component
MEDLIQIGCVSKNFSRYNENILIILASKDFRMPTKSLAVLLPLIFVWIVSAVAGVSLLYSAFHDKSPVPSKKGLRKFFREVRFRLFFAMGTGLILWVISGIVWIVFT